MRKWLNIFRVLNAFSKIRPVKKNAKFFKMPIPGTAVERKSLTDLIGSLQNGRLFTQLMSMKRYYSKPVLLIEFEPGKPFALKALRVKTWQIRELMQKLVLTIIHFPSVRILWSPSSTDTAVMFGELKQFDTTGQPDLDEAQARGD